MVKAKTLLNRTKKQKQSFEPKTPIATEMYLPNQSGDHSAGSVRTTPVNATDIVNKLYVDGEISWQRVSQNWSQIFLNHL